MCSPRFHLIKSLQLHVFQNLNDLMIFITQIDNEFNYICDVTGSEAINDFMTKMYRYRVY